MSSYVSLKPSKKWFNSARINCYSPNYNLISYIRISDFSSVNILLTERTLLLRQTVKKIKWPSGNVRNSRITVRPEIRRNIVKQKDLNLGIYIKYVHHKHGKKFIKRLGVLECKWICFKEEFRRQKTTIRISFKLLKNKVY